MTTIVTGGSSEFGAVAAERLGRAGETRLLIGTRSPASGEADAVRVDLPRLDSVRAFARAVRDRLDGSRINARIRREQHVERL